MQDRQSCLDCRIEMEAVDQLVMAMVLCFPLQTVGSEGHSHA